MDHGECGVGTECSQVRFGLMQQDSAAPSCHILFNLPLLPPPRSPLPPSPSGRRTHRFGAYQKGLQDQQCRALGSWRKFSPSSALSLPTPPCDFLTPSLHLPRQPRLCLRARARTAHNVIACTNQSGAFLHRGADKARCPPPPYVLSATLNRYGL